MRKLITVKKAMLDKGLSCMETALQLGLNPSRFSLILNGWIRPTETIKHKLLETFPDAAEEILQLEGVV